jgi:hypothetical protein
VRCQPLFSSKLSTVSTTSGTQTDISIVPLCATNMLVKWSHVRVLLCPDSLYQQTMHVAINYLVESLVLIKYLEFLPSAPSGTQSSHFSIFHLNIFSTQQASYNKSDCESARK